MIKTKASVQYNDFIGTSAADISDHSTLNEFASHYGLDPQKYIPRGISLYCNYNNFVSVSLLCEDIEHGNKLISVSLPEMPISDFLNQFKRLHVMLFTRYYNPEDEVEELQLEKLVEADK